MGLIVLGVALLLALAVPTILVLVDRKIRNGQVIEQMLGFPPIGLIMDRGQTKLKLGESFAEQQFLRLLSGIDRARRSSNAKLFVLTSVKHGGGTSSVVERISQALKQQGLRIAVVTPTRNSAEYPTIGDKSQPVQGEGFVERIYLPVCDPSVGMFSTNRLTAIFDKLKRDYDLVLVDAPPLLMSAETEILVCMCQATLLVVEADHITKEDLLKAAKLLERLRPEATGVILNRVKIKTAGWHLRREYREYTNGLNSKETIRPAA
jgi:Mrp family chromosome partitioning ATPase